MRRRRPLARARPPTPPIRRRRRRRLRLPTRPRTPSGGGQAHARAQPCFCAQRARTPARACAAGTLPPQPPPPTPCSRFKCRGARAWSGWARRGDRAYGTTTDTTIPHCEYPIHGMGEAAEAASDGGTYSGDGGARDAREVGGSGRAARPAAQHTVAGRGVRTGRTFTVTSPLPASRADEKQLPASPEQVRERRAGVGGRRGGGGRAARGGRRGRRQEGRAAAEGHALVGAHGRAAGRGGRRAALRHGAAPARAAAARQVTARARRGRSRSISRLHSIVGTSAVAGARRRVPEYYRLGIYLFGAARRAPVRVAPERGVFLASSDFREN